MFFGVDRGSVMGKRPHIGLCANRERIWVKLTVIEAEYELDSGAVVRLNAPASGQN